MQRSAKNSAAPVSGDAPEAPGQSHAMGGEPAHSLQSSASRTAIMAAAGLLGGVIAWFLIERVHDAAFPLAPEVAKLWDQSGVPPEDMAVILAAERVQTFSRTALAIGIFGAAVGLCVVLGQSLAQRTPRSTILWAAPTGLALGGLLGALGGIAGTYVYEHFREPEVDMMLYAMLAHGIYWAVAGVGIGLPAGLAARSAGSAGRSIVMGITAGILAALLYLPVASYAFPVEKSDKLVPDGTWNRLIWVGTAAVLIGAALAPSSKAKLRPLQ